MCCTETIEIRNKVFLKEKQVFKCLKKSKEAKGRSELAIFIQF